MELGKNSKSAKEEKPQVPLSASLPLSGTNEHLLALLRAESAAEGRIDYALGLYLWLETKQTNTFHPLGVELEMVTALLFSF
ncbi:hypothetical protein LR48_Vigan04g092400 [Vigna angularis]|uniref:Uncharacterized protein n=1 Tax=Phaseolus angularis TaxID=3914 RepID=A0A0L9UDD5_PHAAN|nr:hypothetical protein LR48_Vigan04g092400 [Vigna angularis]